MVMAKEYVTDEPRGFVVPPKRSASEEYTAKVERVAGVGGGWATTHVTVLRNHDDGTVTTAFEYDRNYSMYSTFEPFRQLKDGVWHDYALISSRYTRFEVVDLEAGEIIATQPYPRVTQRDIDRTSSPTRKSSLVLDAEMSGWGFCPTEFRVLDWNAYFDEENVDKTTVDPEGRSFYLYPTEMLNRITGQWAIYAGCLWGDEENMKMRYIDLSRISEGIVTADERFGYMPLSNKLKNVTYDRTADSFYVPVEAVAVRETGKVVPLDVNWMNEEEYDNWDY